MSQQKQNININAALPPNPDGYGVKQCKHSNAYYIWEKGDVYAPCKNASGVKNNFGADLFRHKDMIYEGSTGMRVCSTDKLADALKSYDGRAKEFAEVVQKAITENGLSPRYTQPDVKKEALFPRDENRKLTRTLYSKGKRWFFRLYNEHGIELYIMDADKSQVPSLFSLCRDWMIPVGSFNGLSEIVFIMIQPEFDLYSRLESDLEKMLADPAKWADAGIAEFLGRRGEADEHNLPIRQARKLKRAEDMSRREAECRAREEREKSEYESALRDAELAVTEYRSVRNTEINGKSLILQLFRENNIAIPLKTQGWIISSLTEIFRSLESGWSYRYRGNHSTVMMDYLYRLGVVLDEKHRQTIQNVS